MPKTDFFDDDLERQRRGIARHLKMGPAAKELDVLSPGPDSDDVPVRPVSDFNLTRMAKHKEEVSAHMAHAVEQLERLRSKQEELEQEKRGLEELRRKQHEYEQKKAEMISHLSQSLIKLEKDQIQTEQLSELLKATTARFKTMFSELKALNEETWPENRVREELDKALVVLDDTRVEFNKAFTRISTQQSESKGVAMDHPPVIFEERPHHAESTSSFGHWMKIGLAASLPLMVTLIILFTLFFLYQSGRI